METKKKLTILDIFYLLGRIDAKIDAMRKGGERA